MSYLLEEQITSEKENNLSTRADGGKHVLNRKKKITNNLSTIDSLSRIISDCYLSY